MNCPSGQLVGTSIDASGCEQFLGIPYAKPPLGALRFGPAVRHEGWPGLLDATRFGAASAQVFDPHEDTFDELDDGPVRCWAGDEDSLTVNVWRPADRPAPLPVIVWIHGGANWLESSRLPSYDGEPFAAAGTIFVSLNYRLGVFGFLDLSPIGGPASAHSHGLTDQLAALDWVHDNIAAFGGDPDNVTVMGESAGSMDISWLLASGRLPSGVRRLVLMSGVASVVGLGWDGTTSAHDPAEGTRRAAEFLDTLGYTSFDALRAAPTGEILERHARIANQSSILFDMDTLFYPRTGALSPLDPFAAARNGAGQRLEVLLGFTAYEMGLWLNWDDKLDRRAASWTAAAVPHIPEPARGELVQRYSAWFPDEEEGVFGMHMLGDAMFALPTMWLADLLAASGATVYCYRFDWEVGPRVRALHAADQAFLFGHATSPVGEPIVGTPVDGAEAAERLALGRRMADAFIAFAATGEPSASALAWPQWTAEARSTMLFDKVSRVADDPMGERRRWWTANVLPAVLGGGA